MPSLLKMYMGLESLAEPKVDPMVAEVEAIEISEVKEVTADELGDAEYEIEESGKAVDDNGREAAALKSEIEETREAITALEEIQSVLAYGIESEEYSPQFAAAVHIALQPYADLADNGKVLPSLESFNNDTIADFYTVSNEAIGGVIEKIKLAASNMKAAFKKKVGAIGTDKGIVKSVETKADALIARLNDVKTSDAVEINTKFAYSRLGVQGSFTNDLVKASNTDLATYNSIVGTVIPKMTDTAQKAAAHLTKATSQGKADFELSKKEFEAIVALGLIDTAVTPGMRNGSGLFSSQIVSPEKPKLDGTLITDLKALTEYAKGVEMVRIKTTQGSADAKLTKAQVKTLLDNVKRYATLYKKHASVLDAEGGSIYALFEAMEKAKSGGHPAAKAAFDLVGSYVDASWEVSFSRMVDTRHIMSAILGVCERAIGALEKADKASAKKED